MNQPPKPPYRPTPGAMPRGRGPLRLVPQLNPQSPPLVDASATSTEGGQTTVTGTVKAPRPQSHLAKFLTAYADAIDRDIKLILEL